jgi:hypothetical protein
MLADGPLGAFPLLDASADEHSLDWPDAEYSASVAGDGGQWQVRHELVGAPGIIDLIGAGLANYAAEVRCPRTLFSHLACSQGPVTDLQYPETMVRAPVFVVPGVVAVKDCSVATAGAAVVWRYADSEIPVRRGAWLVRGRAVKEDVACSLLRFRTVDELDDHEMHICPDPDQDGNTRLMISIPPVQEPRLRDPAFVAQAWQAALAYLPSCAEFSLDPEADTSNAFVAELEAKLSGMPLWDDEARWDPLRAATQLLGMPTPAQDGDDT